MAQKKLGWTPRALGSAEKLSNQLSDHRNYTDWEAIAKLKGFEKLTKKSKALNFSRPNVKLAYDGLSHSISTPFLDFFIMPG